MSVDGPPTTRLARSDERQAGAASAGAASPGAGWREALKVGLGIWALTRLAFVFFAIGAMQAASQHSIVGKGPGWFPRLYYWWDSVDFYSVAASGYNVATTHPTSGLRNPAFFPGYPMLARLLAMPFGGLHPAGAPLYWSLALLTWVGAAVAAVVLWRLAADQGGPEVANRAVVLLLAGPYAVFLMASYSESVFLAFAVSAWYCGGRGRWWLAGVLAAAAGVVRINGLFLGAGLIVMFAIQYRGTSQRPSRRDGAALCLPFVGTFAYFAWLRAKTGSWRTWFNAQEYWHRKLTWPWTALRGTIHYIEHPRGTRLSPILEVTFAVVAVALLVALTVLRRWAEAVYVGATVVSMTTSTYFLSLPRLCLLLFPAVILLAEWSVRWRWSWPVLLALSLALLSVNSLTFVYHQWTG